MKGYQIRNSLILLLTASIWGFAFVAQSLGMEHLSPFAFCFIRYIMGGTVLIPIAMMTRRGKKHDNKTLLIGGLCCGTALGIASLLQQSAILYTTVGKAGFITATYIVWVPITGIFFGKKNSPVVWLAVIFALAGLYLLCMDGSFTLSTADILLILCALCFTAQILFIDHFSPLVDNVSLSCIQFYTAAAVALIPMLITGLPEINDIKLAMKPLLYAGIMSSGVAYTLQIIGQRNMNPAVASIIMSLESSISVLAGWLLLREQLSSRELIGCGVMLIAIVLAQLPDFFKSKKD